MYVQVGVCPNCGAPLYSPAVWGAIIPPPVTYSCDCKGKPNPTFTAPTTTPQISPIAPNENMAKDDNMAGSYMNDKIALNALMSRNVWQADNDPYTIIIAGGGYNQTQAKAIIRAYFENAVKFEIKNMQLQDSVAAFATKDKEDATVVTVVNIEILQ